MPLLKIVKDKFVPIYFCLLFTLLIFIYLPSFLDPPRSDSWPALFFFHHIDTMPGKIKWLHILNYDPLHQVNFYPLAHLIFYIQYFIFGSNFLYFHILHFTLYCVSLILLYKLAKIFCKDSLLTLIFISVFAFLFSHFDIITWTYHAHILLAFCLFLLGFILYVDFLKTGKSIFLISVIVSFLLGMLCYATFMLWPLAIVALSYIDYFGMRKVSGRKNIILIIGVVYFLYAMLFLASRAIKSYSYPLVSFNNLFSAPEFIMTFLSVFFNIFYNGILVNIMPFTAYPGRIWENVFEIGGLITLYESKIVKIVFFGGILSLAMSVGILIYLIRRRRYEVIKALIFLCFLLFSELFILFRLRLITNNALYNFQQFRYQYISNAFVILVALLIVNNLLGSSKKWRNAAHSFLVAVLIINIYCSARGVSFVSSQLAPLRKVIYNIKKGIELDVINSKNKIYIDDSITKRLPPLCWNNFMGMRYMKGTYQWIFSKKEINCFSFSLKEAGWVIDEDGFNIIRK